MSEAIIKELKRIMMTVDRFSFIEPGQSYSL